MIISDLSHLEIASEAMGIEGGDAFANAGAGATALGNLFSDSFTVTQTQAISNLFGFVASSSSLSASSSTAI